MKQDYLWDATGQDAEIEQLEELLSVYKFETSDPPRPPSAVVSPWWRFWDARFAVPAFATLLLIAGVSVFLLYRFGTQGPGELAAVPEQTVLVPVTAALQPKPSVPVPAPTVTSASLPTGPRYKPTAIRAIQSKRVTSEPKLTREELYAYNQLMLALSITGSSLRAVQDTIDEGEPAAIKPGKIEKLDN